MPDIHIDRHGDRWALREGADATPIFESYTREEAEAEARRRAEGGRVVFAEREEDGREGVGQHSVDAEREPEPHDVRSHTNRGDSGEFVREQQAGL